MEKKNLSAFYHRCIFTDVRWNTPTQPFPRNSPRLPSFEDLVVSQYKIIWNQIPMTKHITFFQHVCLDQH